MGQKILILEGRQFRTESDYACAKRDKEIIDRLREQTDFGNRTQLEALCKDLRDGRYQFLTLLGRDFQDEAEAALKEAQKADDGKTGAGKAGHGRVLGHAGTGQKTGNAGRSGFPAVGRSDRNAVRQSGKTESNEAGQSGRAGSNAAKRAGRTGRGDSGRTGRNTGERSRPVAGKDSAAVDAIVREELRKREKRRKLILRLCSLTAIGCLGYFGVYSYYNYRTRSTYEKLSRLKEKTVAEVSAPNVNTGPLFTLDDEPEAKEVLDEYKNLLNVNKKLIGWVKIDDTNIDYPVMQTTDNEYYLDHNLEQEYDKNGTIFMDKDCDVLKPSTNYILYGHHMKSGQMFGQLDLYKKKSYCEEHPYISFDTIYEKGTYQVMYVFRSRVYKETEIVFKYYQFIDANSEREFDSYMKEMAALSLYDTGVTAEYGDQLLTLSTCDYQETDGRFVVVAKKVAKE